MIKIEFMLSGTDGTITCNDSNYPLSSYLTTGARFSETDADTIVVNGGMLVYSCEDGSFAVVTSGTKKAVFDVAPVAVAAPAPMFEPNPAPAAEAPAA